MPQSCWERKPKLAPPTSWTHVYDNGGSASSAPELSHLTPSVTEKNERMNILSLKWWSAIIIEIGLWKLPPLLFVFMLGTDYGQVPVQAATDISDEWPVLLEEPQSFFLLPAPRVRGFTQRQKLNRMQIVVCRSVYRRSLWRSAEGRANTPTDYIGPT